MKIPQQLYSISVTLPSTDSSDSISVTLMFLLRHAGKTHKQAIMAVSVCWSTAQRQSLRQFTASAVCYWKCVGSLMLYGGKKIHIGFDEVFKCTNVISFFGILYV